MGMSTHIQGFIPDTDDTYQKHKAVFEACMDADVSLPKETAEYFGSEYAEEYLLEEKLTVKIPFTEWSDNNMSSGFEVVISDIPDGVHKIRFSNSW